MTFSGHDDITINIIQGLLLLLLLSFHKSVYGLKAVYVHCQSMLHVTAGCSVCIYVRTPAEYDRPLSSCAALTFDLSDLKSYPQLGISTSSSSCVL